MGRLPCTRTCAFQVDALLVDALVVDALVVDAVLPKVVDAIING
jgi:hypothetical protein